MKSKDKSLLGRFIVIAIVVFAWTFEFYNRDFKLNYGLDLAGGSKFVVTFDEDKLTGDQKASEILDQVQIVLTNRVDREGLKEASIKQTGSNSIEVVMATGGEEDQAKVREQIQQPAKLTFHAVHKDSAKLASEYSALKTDEEKAAFEAPLGYELKIMRPDQGETVGRPIVINKWAEKIDVKGLKAYATTGEFGGNMISLGFSTSGAQGFGAATAEIAKTNGQLAIVLDGTVYSAPSVKNAIHGGSAQITGSFTRKEATELANVLSSGDLPVKIKIDSEFTVSPTLGEESVAAGKYAAFVGLIAVFVFMIVYYCLSGFISAVALGVNILLIFGTMAIFDATLTLPGIAGIVLTIGMAVDANVIIFERIREEFEKGKSAANAIHYGFDRAFVTILDANLTTLLTALILYNIGTGSIKGFAVTLSIGILASMFTALFMTRAMFDLVLRKMTVDTLKMRQLFKRPNFNYLGARRTATIISGVLIAGGLVIMAVRNEKAFSIDFTGGGVIEYKISGNTDLSAEKIDKSIQTALKAKAKSTIASGTEGKVLSVTLPKEIADVEGMISKAEATVYSTLSESLKDTKFEKISTYKIGSSVGSDFQKSAFWSMVLAVLGIIVYISFRFEFKFAIAANIALVHDVLIATGIFLLCGRQISLPVVAALLTIIGYSLNDTIVVFDRIREDLGLIKDKSYSEIINLSINQTLSRTVLTSFTTGIVVLILLLFGGPGVFDFALVMFIGVIVGTYSSIFVASSVVATWHEKDEQAAKLVTETK